MLKEGGFVRKGPMATAVTIDATTGAITGFGAAYRGCLRRSTREHLVQFGRMLFQVRAVVDRTAAGTEVADVVVAV